MLLPAGVLGAGAHAVCVARPGQTTAAAGCLQGPAGAAPGGTLWLLCLPRRSLKWPRRRPVPPSHAQVPVFDWRVLPAAIRRIDLGGKALTNFMKELVSYRQVRYLLI